MAGPEPALRPGRPGRRAARPPRPILRRAVRRTPGDRAPPPPPPPARGRAPAAPGPSARSPVEPGVRATRTTPTAVGAHPGGDGRPLGAQAHHVLTGQDHAHGHPVLVGQAAGDGGHRRVDFAPEGPAVGEGAGRFPAREAPRRIGLEIRRLDEGGAQREGPRPGGRLQRRTRRHGGVAPRHASRRGRGPGRATRPAPTLRARRAPPPGRAPGRCPRRTRHRRGRRGRRRPGACRLRAPPGGPPPPDRAPSSPAAGVRRRWRTRRSASRMLRQPVHRHRWASNARSTAPSSTGVPARAERGEAHDDARRAEAALARSRGRERRRPGGAHRRVQAVERRHRPALRPGGPA